MITINLSASTLKATFNQLTSNLGGIVDRESNEYVLTLNNNFGTGTIKGIFLSDGMSYIEFDVVFHQDITFSINTPNKNPMYFAYCSQGKLIHNFGVGKKIRVLDNFQTGIITSQLGDENRLYFRKKEHTKFTLISVDISEKHSKNKVLQNELYATFVKDYSLDNFVYIGSQNLKIAEKIQQIKNFGHKGLVRTLFVQGMVHVILSLEIQQHKEDKKNSENQTSTLTTREMKIIEQASVYIEHNFDQQISISLLCSEFGISPAKLQMGFKSMHGRTVVDYIRTFRIKKAEEFIKNTDMNISEVVYNIGFSSRSYFSKIFKETYNCCPSAYKSAQRTYSIPA